ncbi:MAG: HAD family hydrolase [Clostridia bacterium]|nr:HAD family hydrolase [Clostridia bacterium]
MKYNTIIWDYNGTIIDDAPISVEAENIVMSSYGRQEISLELYRQECVMPIEIFYRKVYDMDGIDFNDMAVRFMENYDKLVHKATAFSDVKELIKMCHDNGIRQGVISGFETSHLISGLKSFGLDGYFDFMSGADDHSCGDKSERAVAVAKKYGVETQKTLFIGDMYHDYETADKIGADCVLIARGHQGAQPLRNHGNVIVLDNAQPLIDMIFG